MRILRLSIRDFRNHEALDVEFGNGVTAITGANGVGKTAILEALYLLSCGRSWRTEGDIPLIRDGKEEAFVEAVVEKGAARRTASVFLSRKGKKGRINGEPTRSLTELSSVLNVVLFSPEDASLLKGSPKNRRSLIDMTIGKADPEYMANLREHNAVLAERNAALKEESPNIPYIETVTERLAPLAVAIERKRRSFFEGLEKPLAAIGGDLALEKGALTLKGHAFLGPDGDEKEAYVLYMADIQRDLARGATSNGPQKDDFSLLADGKDLAIYGSQGENRLAVLALKLAIVETASVNGSGPTLLLDDAFSELDGKRSEALKKRIGAIGQAIVTGNELDIKDSRELRLEALRGA